MARGTGKNWNHGFGMPSWNHGFGLPTWHGYSVSPAHPKVKHPKAPRKPRHARHLRHPGAHHRNQYRDARGRFAKRPKK